MTTTGKFLVLFCLSLTILSCNTPKKFFNRPDFVQAINSNCTGFVNGEQVDVTNWLSISPESPLMDYYERREYCNYICVKFPKRCKGCK